MGTQGLGLSWACEFNVVCLILVTYLALNANVFSVGIRTCWYRERVWGLNQRLSNNDCVLPKNVGL